MMRQALDLHLKKLGLRHPDTTVSQWWLAVMLEDLDELEERARILDAMKWLLEADDSELSASQRAARQYVRRELSRH